MSLPKQVYIRELGPREGFQTLSKSVPTTDKVALINLLSKTGVPLIEITSFVRPDKVPQMADASEVVKLYERVKGVEYTGLYLNEKGFENCEATNRLDNEGWLYTAASESFLKHNSNCTIADTINKVPGWIELFAKYKKKLRGVMISTAFGCNYEGAIDPKKVLEILKSIQEKCEASNISIPEISLADTVGRGNPNSVKRLINDVRKTFSKSVVSLHLHDTRGSGMANVYAGLEEGVDILEASVGGMGGCPFAKGAAGNVATEDVVYLCHELGIKTGISLEGYVEAARFAAGIVGMPLPGKYYKAVLGTPS